MLCFDFTLWLQSTLWVCAIMFLLSYFGRIHMCTLCKPQNGPAGGGGRGESTRRQRRAFSLRSSTGELFKKPSFSTPFSEIQLAETSGACSGETGNARYHRSRSPDRDVYCDFRDTCCLSPFDWQHRQLSALFPRPSNGGLQPPLANATDAEPISFGRGRAVFRTTNPGCIARACIFSFSFVLFFSGSFLLILRGWHCVTQTRDTNPTVTFCDPLHPGSCPKCQLRQGQRQ